MSKDLSFEKKRKIFHVSGLLFPLIYLFISKFQLLVLLFLIIAVTIALDTSRHYNPKIKILVDKFFSPIMRKSEMSGSFRLSGLSYMLAGLFLSALFFSKDLAITSWLILIIADPIATLTGMKIGTRKFNGKTLEGSYAFLVSAIFISILSYFYIRYNTSFLVIILSCLVATALEFYSKKLNVDDNLLIPLGYGLATSLLNFIF